jgi:HAD superfamily hydrolase (TIGR01549 family)
VKRRFDGVLFDFGHTLFSTAGGAEACVEFAAAQGIGLDPTAVRSAIAAAWARAITPEEIAKGRDLDAARHRACWLELYGPLDDLAPGLARHLYERDTGPDGWQAFADARPTLVALDEAGVRMAVVSDVAFDLRPLLEAAGLDRFVRVYVLSYRLGVTKPHPSMFERALADLGVAADRALMVGDSAAADGGAVALGMPVLLLPPHHGDGPRGLDLVRRAVFA